MLYDRWNLEDQRRETERKQKDARVYNLIAVALLAGVVSMGALLFLWAS